MKLKILGVCSLMSVFCFSDIYGSSEDLSDENVAISKKRVETINKELMDLVEKIQELNEDIGLSGNILKGVREPKESGKVSNQSTEDSEESAEEITLDEDFTFANSIDFLDKVKQADQLTDSNKENIQKIFDKFGIIQTIDDEITEDWWTQVFRKVWAAGIKSYIPVINRFYDSIKNASLEKKYENLVSNGDSCFSGEQGYYEIFESKIFNTTLFNVNENLNSDRKAFNKSLTDIRRDLYPKAKKAWVSVKELIDNGEEVGDSLKELGEVTKELLSKVSGFSGYETVKHLFSKQSINNKKQKRNKRKKG